MLKRLYYKRVCVRTCLFIYSYVRQFRISGDDILYASSGTHVDGSCIKLLSKFPWGGNL